MNHYTYYSYEEWGRGYIGVRSCDCSPEEDLYLGSYTDQTFEPTHKIILSTHETREEATQAEVDLHEFFNVSTNNHFANKANQTAAGFDYSGRTHSSKTKQKMREQKSGDKNNMFGKTHSKEAKDKIGKASKGRSHTAEVKKKMSKNRTGSGNSMYGRKHSEATKQKLREAALRRSKRKTVTDG